MYITSSLAAHKQNENIIMTQPVQEWNEQYTGQPECDDSAIKMAIKS